MLDSLQSCLESLLRRSDFVHVHVKPWGHSGRSRSSVDFGLITSVLKPFSFLLDILQSYYFVLHSFIPSKITIVFLLSFLILLKGLHNIHQTTVTSRSGGARMAATALAAFSLVDFRLLVELLLEVFGNPHARYRGIMSVRTVLSFGDVKIEDL